jgi:ankyrin repeat protein
MENSKSSPPNLGGELFFATLLCLFVSLWLFAGTSDVADAAMKKDAAALRALIQQKADVNAPQADGTTALHWAARWNDLEMAASLIRAGANAQAANRTGATPMFLAAVNGSAAMIETLLKAGAPANAPVLSHGETALMMAARTGKLDAVRMLTSRGADVHAKENLRGTDALMWAAEQGHADIVKFLLDSGAEVGAQSKIIRPIRRNGLGFGRPGPDGRPPAGDPMGGLTPLLFAVREGGLQTVHVLVTAGADVNRAAADGSSPLLVAVQNGNYEIAQFLLDHGANLNQANAKGWTPLYLAVSNRDALTTAVPAPSSDGALDFIRILLDRGADPNHRIQVHTEVHAANTSLWLKEEGATPLLRAALCGDLTVVRLLLAHGADPSIPTLDQTTPLMVASGVGWAEGFTFQYSEDETVQLVKLLLELGAPINAGNEDGLTALHGAAYKGANKVVQLLVDRGADLSAKDKGKDYGFGVTSVRMTPLNWAEGVPIGMSSAIYHDDTVTLVARLMQERGIPVEYHTFHGEKSTDTPLIGEPR